MAGLKPTILFESRDPHTLLALAEARHEVAIVPSQLQCHRYMLRIVGLAYRGRRLREPISWDKRRARRAMRKTFPISRPTKPPAATRSR